MRHDEERRSATARRVPVETLVEMCGLHSEAAPAFEARSVNVSGRGMHVRAAHLPEVGAPLVCRFEQRGQEIIVEGVVAWRRDEPGGAEFGLRFTALDKGSVDALRDLCGMQLEAVVQAAGASPPTPENSPKATPGDSPGSRVRLHIDGLESPMRARVREGGKRRVYVGSNLEFLAVGRPLQLENLDQEHRSSARVDAVDVVIDPHSQIPQLVIALHYDDVDATPEPSVIDTESGTPEPTATHPFGVEISQPAPQTQGRNAALAADGVPTEEVEAGAAPEPAAPDPDIAEEVNAFRSRLDVAAAGANSAAKSASVAAARLGAATASRMKVLLQEAATRVKSLRQPGAAEKKALRRTTAHPDGPLSVEGARLRPQSRPPGGAPMRRQGQPATAATPPPKSKQARVKVVAVGTAVIALLVTAGAITIREPAPPPGAEAGARPAQPVAVAVADDVTRVDEQGNPLPQVAKVKRLEEPKPVTTGITADVPLFGPTPMATMEPAPLGPAPSEVSNDSAPAASKVVAVEDEVFEEAAPPPKPADVSPWGRGRMHLPVIHRLPLDAPGAAIQGAVAATGFTVLIPKRKVMAEGGSIQKRDKRIARVRTRNTAAGAEISFKFREGVPAYRVRLRKSAVEFLVSSPKEK